MERRGDGGAGLFGLLDRLLRRAAVACCKADTADRACTEAGEADWMIRRCFDEHVGPFIGSRPAEMGQKLEDPRSWDELLDVDVDSVETGSNLPRPPALSPPKSPACDRGLGLGGRPPGGIPTTSTPTTSASSTSVGSRYSSDRDTLEDRGPLLVDGGEGTYTGQWLGDYRCGRGVLRWSSGQCYEGQFRNDLPHGRGTLMEADGGTYDGLWENGKRQGHGVYRHADGTVYDGLWAVDEKSDSGAEQWTDGARYEGQYCKGVKHGSGIFTGVCTLYVGEFAADQMHGKGRFSFSDGRMYIGEWSHGKMHGEGRTEWPSGAIYEGGFRDGQRSGYGTYSCNGESYAGQWLAGHKHGKGYSDLGNGDWYEEVWHSGERIEPSCFGIEETKAEVTLGIGGHIRLLDVIAC